MASLRVLISSFANEFDGIEMELDSDGDVSAARWPELVVPDSHELIDRVGQISGETATLFAWVPEEGDFIRRTTNIVKPDGSRAVGTWLGKENPVHAAMLRRETFKGKAMILGKSYYTIYQPILNASNEVVGIFYVGVSRAAIDAQVMQRLKLGLAATAVATLLGVLGAMLLLNRGLRPLTDISARLKDMAEGDLTAEVPHKDRPDALGAAAQTVETFREQLAQAKAGEAEGERKAAEQARVVTALRKGLEAIAERNLAVRIEGAPFPAEYQALRDDFDAGVDSLAKALAEADGVALGVRNAANEIGTTSDDLARRVEMQAGTLMQSAEALNQVTASSREIAGNVEEADRLAMTSRQLSDESGQVVRRAIEAINRIEATSDKINQIISAIDDIAFQTNLLALNAGVEAARAGEAGKGFAVVASEVRSLAQTAAQSAQEIKTLILSSSEEVREGSELVQKTGASLDEVQKQVAELGSLITNIAGSVRSQTDSLGEINDGVQRLEGATQENAAIVEQLNAAGQSLNIEAERLADTLGAFAHGRSVTAGIEVATDRKPAVPAAGSWQAERALEWDDLPEAEPVAVNAPARSAPVRAASKPHNGSWDEF
ncbi:methyl-accepting chemotaxis protein [Tropicibacter alexandrii]|uniref:methyl-accepting chemotaxis protein n=1 Tax=Tropicibacter alexandrii TaxID=2267683 RepID=UPI001F0C9A98|nr:methyl-accepting chemotaxis protein [Tropicibacter alexandrii]